MNNQNDGLDSKPLNSLNFRETKGKYLKVCIISNH